MRLAARIEWYIAAAATLLAAYWHWVNLKSAGGLWRDEAQSATLAQLPSMNEIWQALPYDSFPLLSTIVVRTWSGTGWGATDVGLRTLGLLIGLGILAALWMNAWRCAGVPPTLSLLLWGLSPLAIRFGDAVRPLGWGVLMIVLAWGLIWQVVEEPRRLRVLLATLSTVAAVQTLYQNALFVFVLIGMGILISGCRRQWRTAAILLAIGIVAALSLAPYVDAVRKAQEWSIVASAQKAGLVVVWQRLWLSIGRDGVFFLLAWWCGIVATVVIASQQYFAPRRDNQPVDRWLPLYCAVTMLGGGAFQIGMLAAAGVLTQPWHYLPLLAVGGTALDRAVGTVANVAWLRSTLLVCGACLLSFQGTGNLRSRQTNLDTVAGVLNAEAEPGDLIVVAPWYHGVTFHRYYHGPAAWTTLPQFEEKKLHRYDELKELLLTPGAHLPLLKRVAATLEGGHRVWMVGDSPRLLVNQQLPPEPIVPDLVTGWDSSPHIQYWAYALGSFLQTHERSRSVIDVNNPEAVSPLEHSELSVSEGWRP